MQLQGARLAPRTPPNPSQLYRERQSKEAFDRQCIFESSQHAEERNIGCLHDHDAQIHVLREARGLEIGDPLGESLVCAGIKDWVSSDVEGKEKPFIEKRCWSC